MDKIGSTAQPVQASKVEDTYTARLERALCMADSVIANLLDAYDSNDMDSVTKLLGKLSLGRAKTAGKVH